LISDSDILKLYVKAEKYHNLSVSSGDFDKLREDAYNSIVNLGFGKFTYLLDDNEFLIQIVKDIIGEFRSNFSVFSEKLSEYTPVAEFGETLIEDLPDSVDQLLQSLEIAPTIESVSKRLPYLYNDLITELYYCR